MLNNTSTDARKRKPSESTNLSPKYKNLKMNKLCAHCKLPTTGSEVWCTKCYKCYHGETNCSKLSIQEFKQAVEKKNYICQTCVKDISMTEASGSSEPSQQDGGNPMLLLQILSEIRKCNQNLDELRHEQCALRQEQNELKRMVINIQKNQAESNHRGNRQPMGHGRVQPKPHGRNTSKTRNSRDRSSSRSRSQSQNRNPPWRQVEPNIHARRTYDSQRTDQYNNNGKQPQSRSQYNSQNQYKSNSQFQGNKKKGKGEYRVRIAEDYENEETKSNLLRALPLSAGRICKKNIILTLYNTDASCKLVFAHLKNNGFDIAKISRLQTEYDYYKCFVLECMDLEFDAILDSKIWHPQTKLRQFFGELDVEKVIESYPKK